MTRRKNNKSLEKVPNDVLRECVLDALRYWSAEGDNGWERRWDRHRKEWSDYLLIHNKDVEELSWEDWGREREAWLRTQLFENVGEGSVIRRLAAQKKQRKKWIRPRKKGFSKKSLVVPGAFFKGCSMHPYIKKVISVFSRKEEKWVRYIFVTGTNTGIELESKLVIFIGGNELCAEPLSKEDP